MKLLQTVLNPLSWLYGGLLSIRNFMFEIGILSQYKSPLKVISVGNLSMGGSGKTPHIIFLLKILKQKNKAVISRGYGRESIKLIEGNPNIHSSKDIGDEPLEILEQFENEEFKMIVDSNRKNALIYLERMKSSIDIILLDDGFQHRYVKRDLNILLTDINKPFYNDNVFPAGNLRESKNGAKRADIIIVTKCSESLSKEKQRMIKNSIKTYSQAPVFFSKIVYKGFKNANNKTQKILLHKKYLLVTSIAFPEPIKKHLKSIKIVFDSMTYKDHHQFSNNEIKEIAKKSINFEGIITTQKDWIRLRESSLICITKTPIFRIDIEVQLIHSDNEFVTRLNQIN